MTKFVVEIFGQKIVMENEQLDALIEVMRSCTRIHQEYVGNGQGDDGGHYKSLIREIALDEVKVNVLPSDVYDARVLVTKLWDESKAKK